MFAQSEMGFLERVFSPGRTARFALPFAQRVP
jgi:hypothetical protein